MSDKDTMNVYTFNFDRFRNLFGWNSPRWHSTQSSRWINTPAQDLSNQTSEWNDRHPLLTKDEFMHWWSHWSRKWLWALDAELWSWNMCRCWCRSVGWCQDHTYYSYANVVGIYSFCHSSSAKQHSLNSNSWLTIGGTSPHPLSAFRHLPKSFSRSPKFLCSSLTYQH